MVCTGAIFTSIYHTKQLNLWPNSSASCVVNHSWPSACQEEMEPFKDHPSTSEYLASLRNKPQQKQPIGNFQHQYLPECLVNVYSYHLTVKSVFYCFMHRSQLFLDPQIQLHTQTHTHIIRLDIPTN